MSMHNTYAVLVAPWNSIICPGARIFKPDRGMEVSMALLLYVSRDNKHEMQLP